MRILPFERSCWHLGAVVLLAGLTGLAGRASAAAGGEATTMLPFRVEAEAGVDGLRIQNSTSVLNPYLLSQHGAGQLQDISGLAPNLFLSNSDTRGFGDVLVLRGVANSIFFSAPAIGLYIDGVPGGTVSSYPSTLLNVEEFVVKAGPQGTEYGRNAPGGVIDIRTRAPGRRHQGRLQVEYGSYNYSALEAVFDGPLGRRWAYSLSLGLSDRDGYIENTFLNKTSDDRRSVAARGALFWQPDDKTTVRLGLLAERARDDATRLSSLLAPDPFVVASNLAEETSLERWQLSLQWKRRFGWGSLVATTSRQNWDLDPSLTDLDLSPLPLGLSRVVQGEKLWTQEVRLESAPGAGGRQWRAGVFCSDLESDGDATREFVVPPNAMVPPNFVQTERTRYAIGQDSLAAYASIDQPVAPRTLLKFGVRFEQARAEVDRTKTSANNLGFPTAPEPRLLRSSRKNLLSATAGLQHSVARALNVVARVAAAQKPDGFTGFTADPTLAHFARERQWTGEVGLTFGTPGSRFGGSLLGFWSVIKDYQFERTVLNSTNYVVVNAPEVAARGIEAKAMWSPRERVWWDFQIGCTDATYEDHRDVAGARVDGNHVPFVPRLTLRTGVSVDLGHGVSANVSYAGTGRTNYDERNTARFTQPSYGLVNAQVRARREAWTCALYVQNLLDEHYWQFINPEIAAGSPGAPRRFGVQVSFEY